MKRIILAIIFLLAAAFDAQAQTSAVTATITDSDSQTWNNGTYTITFVPSRTNSAPPVWNGSPMTTAQKGPYTGSLSNSGVLTVSLPDNSFITPPNSAWLFVLCPNASAPCSQVQTPVTGATPNLSTTLSNGVTAPRFPALGSQSRGYLDAEVSPTPLQGQTYYNVTSGSIRLWNGSAWATGGGIGSGPGGSNTQLQFNNAGAFGGATLDYTAQDHNICSGLCDDLINERSMSMFIRSTDGLNKFLLQTQNATIAQSIVLGVSAQMGSPGANANAITGISTVSGNTNQGQCYTTAASGPPCSLAIFAEPGDLSGDANNGQDIVSFASEPLFNKSSGSVNKVSHFLAFTPLEAGTDRAVNLFGFEMFDQFGLSTTELALVHLENQTNVFSGSQFAIHSLDTHLSSFAGQINMPVLGLAGATSGVATLTPPAVAGTSTNPVVSSNVIQVAGGTNASNGFQFTGCSTCGMNTGGGITLSIESGSGANIFMNPNNAATATQWSFQGSGQFQPSNDNTQPIGGASNRVSNIFAATTTFNTMGTATNCSSVGTAANPSVAACGSAAAGAFSCATNASAGTCTINTTAVTANSEIFVIEVADEGTRLGVTCNTAPTAPPAIVLATKTAGTGFTINMPTIATNPACFDYYIVN